jgi:cytochrome oxidase Cu insertion factor (SCO1/SenC/PrrC family)
MKRYKLVTLLLLLLVNGLVRAQTQLGPKDTTKIPSADLNRLKIGDEAPDFTLEDQDARPVTLSGYRGQKTVVLVFYRGYW